MSEMNIPPDEITSIEDIQKLAVARFDNWSHYGHVTVRKSGQLMIFNYNTMAQYEARWNFFELVSRGLIINAKTGEIVARPFDKFFNWFEGGRRAKGHMISVTEKVDGSIGILYRAAEGYRVATRGHFSSPQAEWATAYLNANYNLDGLPNEYTLLFEIIYPDNRIIVDYRERQDLVLLAVRNRFTGDYLPFFPDVYELAHRYGFSLPKVYTFNNVSEIIAKTGELPPDEEGYVVEFSDGSRFKFKGDAYLELQKLVMSLTFKNVLKAMASGHIRQMLRVVPDEFLVETRQWIEEIRTTIGSVQRTAQAAFDAAPKGSRKEFALWVQKHHRPPMSKYLYALLDGRDIDPLIYQNHPWSYTDDEDV